MKKYSIIAILSVIVGILLDQYTKLLAAAHLKEAPITIIKGVFQLHYLENRGAAFGMLQNQQMFFLITGVIMIAVVSVLYLRLPLTKRMLPLRICFILIASGAIGNMIDRVRLNYVIDFFYFELINFPIFNVADIYVTLAAAGLIFCILFYYKDKELEELFKKKAKQEQ